MADAHFRITNYLDDFLFIAPDEASCNNLVSTFLSICSEIGCMVAHEKTVWATQLITFLGILLDGQNYLLSIPTQKRDKALNMLSYVIKKKKVTVKQVQRLAGLLNFLNKAIVPGRTFTRCLYDKMRLKDKHGNQLKSYHHINLTRGNILDCEVWRVFSCRIPHCNVYVDLSLTLITQRNPLIFVSTRMPLSTKN